MAWTVEYLSTARKQLKKLDPQVSGRMIRFLRERVEAGDPYSVGAALTGPWVGYWKYRVGDYRIICQIRDEKLIVLVVNIGHRSEIYKRGGPQS